MTAFDTSDMVETMTVNELSVSPGDEVVVVDYEGIEHTMYALTPLETEGHDFPIVWVAPKPGEREKRLPWPAEDVRPVKRDSSYTEKG